MNDSPRNNPHVVADVCLLLEGTFPYVRGGVSTWVRQLIEGMPQLTFSIVFLGAHRGEYDELAYALPDNVVHLELHYLLDSDAAPLQKKTWRQRLTSRQGIFKRNSSMHDVLRDEPGAVESRVGKVFSQLLIGEDAIDQEEMNHGKCAWETIKKQYENAPAGLDFNHYFWTVKAMHAPLFTLARIARQAPAARLYHSVSTGYSGFLATLIKSATGLPYIISEHGIYTKERELDLAQVDWIPEEIDPFRVGLSDDMNYLRSVWIRFFRSIGKMSYSSANQVYTLYNGNRQRQIADGACQERLHIVPNGVDVARFAKVRRAPDEPVPPVVALIGRVVPIKDIKTFIRAMRIIRTRIPGAEGWLVGPQDEDPEYTRECRQLVESLGLNKVIKFLGFQAPEDIFPKIGLSVLTSVSEGQPLVVLEGFAAGVPAVTTDVGSCTELICGINEADRALGNAGAVVPIASPSEFAEQAVALLGDTQRWQSASRAAVERVETYYDERDMVDRYRRIYESEAADPAGMKRAS